MLLLAVAIAAILLLGFWIEGRSKGPQYLTAAVQRGSLTSAVEATGTINPLTTVPVGSYVSGIVKLVFADFNSRVRAGQVLAQIDPAVYQAQVVTARGNLASAEATLRQLQAALGSSRAQIETGEANAAKAQADTSYARANAQRTAKLYTQGLLPLDQRELSQSTLGQSEAGTRAATAQVTQARAQHQEALAQVERARAEIQAMRGALQQAEANLRYTTILSPTDGTVVAKNVTVGQSVAASLQAPNLFTIAQDLKRMQVYAKTDESDTGFIKVGGEAAFQVDAFPNERFHGQVSAIRLNAYVVQNVVTYDTVIGVSNPDMKLKPGMTANVSLVIANRDDVLKISNAALRYRPAESKATESKATAAPRGPRAGSGSGKRAYADHPVGRTVYVLTSGEPKPVQIKTGISDGVFTEVLEGLKDGDRVVTASLSANADNAQPATNPFSGNRRRF